jgi:hypothetical protein
MRDSHQNELVDIHKAEFWQKEFQEMNTLV